MSKKYTLYCHTNKINSKKYIGITCRENINIRWQKGKGYSTQIFGKAIDKYGWDNFEHEILFENLDKDEAESKEIELIKKYNTTNRKLGYNISKGGGLPIHNLIDKVYCIETKEVFNNAEEVLKKQPHYKSTTVSDIHMCCKRKLKYVNRPWIKNGKYHYQYYTNHIIKDICELESIVEEGLSNYSKSLLIKNNKSELKKQQNRERRNQIYQEKIKEYIKDNIKFFICEKCGRPIKLKPSKKGRDGKPKYNGCNKKYCGNCKRWKS